MLKVQKYERLALRPSHKILLQDIAVTALVYYHLLAIAVDLLLCKLSTNVLCKLIIIF